MSISATPATTLGGKPHFEILDGLRGVAAIAVLIYHFMEIAVPDYTQNFIAHGHLAVDFFFCLSGFVIAYAYDKRMPQIGVSNFFKLRLIRLHPLVVIGSVIGLITFIFDPFSNLHQSFSTGTIVLMTICSCLLIPYPVVAQRYFNLFHLNPPTWSLFWEYVANLAYALVLVRLPKWALWLLLAVAAVLLWQESYRSGYLGVGWSGDNIMGGGIRVFYSFTAGMLLYRLQWIIRSGLGFVSLSLLLFLAFLIPFSKTTNPFVEPLVVIFYFPLLIALGAGARLKPSVQRICTFLGAISYPLYMVHYPFIWIFFSYVEVYKPSLAQMSAIIPAGALLLIGLAYAVMIYVEQPVRAALQKKLRPRVAKTSAV